MSKHQFNRNFAIIIGINDYVNGIRELETAVPDAHKLAQIIQKQHQNLKQQYQAQNKYEVQLLLNKRVTFSKLKQLIEDFKQGQIPFDNEKVAITESDRVLFYFAGHGIALEALENQEGPVGYLIPQDATLGDSSTYLPMQELHDALNALPCRHLLAILDCCFAGAFRWASLKREILPKVTVYKERYDRFISDAAWQVITSAADDQKALDSLGMRGEVKEGNEVHSPFAKALFDALRGTDKKADSNDDGIVTATELYSYLRDQVEVVTEKNYKRQTPSLCPLRKHDKGEFIFLLPNFDRDKLEDAPPLNLENNPYRGLQSYDEKDSKLFFGRENLIKQLYQQVVDNKQTLTVVLGASGTGKSSLMKAGLLPCLRDSQEHKFQILDPMRPGESPLQALAQAWGAIATTITVAELAKSEQALANIIERWSQTNPQIKLLLAVDQFEELITLCKSDEQREQFQKLIENAIAKYPDKIHVVITLRLDFEGQFQNSILKDFWNDDTRFVVPPMTQDEFREAIEKPASEKVVYFDPPSLVDELINEVVQMPGALPLLSFTLSELYLKYLKERRDNRALKKEDYEELGRVVGSLTKRANQEYDQLVAKDPAYEKTVRRVMLRMISLQGGELARRQVPKSELIYSDKKESDRVQTVIKRFSEARLIVEGSNSQGKPYVEPAHDALVQGWDKLLKWKKEEEEDIILQRRLTPAAEEWKSVASKEQPSGLQAKAETVIDRLDRCFYVVENLSSKFSKKIITWLFQGLQQRQHQQEGLREKPIQFLWNSNPYLDVLNWQLQSHDNWFNKLETEFVQQSVLQKRRNISWQWRIAIAIILSLSGLTLWALFSQRSAKIGETSASRETAEAKLPQQGLDALVYSLRAGRSLQYPLLQLFSPGEQLQNQVTGTLQEAVYSVRERIRMEEAKGTVRSFLSPDNRLLASAGNDDTIRLWDLKGHLVKKWSAEQGLVTNLTFNPDGQLIATAGRNDTVRLWNLQGHLVKELSADQSFVKSISFSSNGQLLATGGANDTVRLWDLQGNPIGQPFTRKLVPQQQEEKLVWGVAFSPNDQIIASAGDDGLISLWNLQGQLLREWQGNQKDISSIKFSPDGQRLATAGEDKTVRLWDLQGQPLAEPFTGHQGRIWDVVFSHDGQQLASAAGDGTMRVWDLKGKQLDEFQGHQGPVRSVSISKDDKLIVSAGDDGTIRVWNLKDEQVQFRQHQYPVRSVSFSRDGKEIASAGDDGTVRLWNLQAQQLGQPFQGHRGKVLSVSFSPDGQQIASAGEDGTVRLWNLQTQKLVQFQIYQGKVRSISFSPDGKQIASAGDDGTVRLWNLQGQSNPQAFLGHRGKVNSVSFSPDGRHIVSAGDDATVRLWNLQGQQLGSFQGHLGPVYATAFSLDGKQIASAGDDGTIRLWNLQGEPIKQPFQVSGIKLKAVAFSPDGKMIAVSGDKGTVQLWNLQGEKFAAWIGHRNFEVESVSFSPDGKLLATAGDDGIAGLWHIQSFDDLIQGACDRLSDYLQNNPNVESDRHLCNNLPSTPANSDK
ncbi:WD-40 repeat-containing protein [Nostoc commune NIES-4072]|uniref:WD-40 repeat-containing protein n=1 Tax=Nostoc commune NIES-4072 TaxID=2005467 RepID=A0A2R5FZ98_NOSCO|nr:caspase family protein [Nostoc commune]BBD68032.1 WD-40 repeat-containing protein [Nostoc commune HK-02]GBG20974.1 WD-40 repeat-containing protein [Nostoc commune NIES-4072]